MFISYQCICSPIVSYLIFCDIEQNSNTDKLKLKVCRNVLLVIKLYEVYKFLSMISIDTCIIICLANYYSFIIPCAVDLQTWIVFSLNQTPFMTHCSDDN